MRTGGTMAVVALATALVMSGCKKKEPTAAERLAAAKPKIEAKVAVMERIAKAPLPAANGTLSVPKPLRVDMGDEPPSSNATIAFDADLKDDFTWVAAVDVRGAAGVANDCVMLARKGLMAGIHDKMFNRDPMPPDDMDAKRVLPRCEMLEYLVVVKMLDFKGTTYIDKETFGGGRARAEALVFDLATGKYLGGVPVAATSSKMTKSDIDTDLMSNFRSALTAAIQAKLPDAKL